MSYVIVRCTVFWIKESEASGKDIWRIIWIWHTNRRRGRGPATLHRWFLYRKFLTSLIWTVATSMPFLEVVTYANLVFKSCIWKAKVGRPTTTISRTPKKVFTLTSMLFYTSHPSQLPYGRRSSSLELIHTKWIEFASNSGLQHVPPLLIIHYSPTTLWTHRHPLHLPISIM